MRTLVTFVHENSQDENTTCFIGTDGSGKTDLSIGIAKAFGTEIISCDSRQIYKEMRIGTAVPSPGQLAAVRHHFIQMISVHDYYNSWQFEVQALERIRELFQEKEVVLMTVDRCCISMPYVKV